MRGWLLSLMLLAGPLAAAEQAPLEQRAQARWPLQCLLLKRSLGDDPALDVVFSEPAAVTAPMWRLRWAGVDVPVPPARYTALAVTPTPRDGAPSDDHVLILKAASGELVFLSYISGFGPQEDMFAQSNLAGDSISSAEGREATRLAWGGTPTQAQIQRHGFEVTPADLDCRPQGWRRGMRDALSLTLKSIAGPGVLEAAYPVPGHPLGWLVREKTADGVLWRALLPRTATPDLATHIELHLPRGAPTLGLGADFPRQSNPQWLEQLALALREDRRADWEALLAAIRIAGFDTASQERLRKLISTRFPR